MRQLKIGPISTYGTWGLLLSDKRITTPEIKTYIIDIPGRSGTLDLTDIMGGVRYNDREAEFILTPIEGNYSQRMEKYKEVVKFFHGKSVYVEEPDRPGESLLGCWQVSEPNKIAGDLFNFKIYCKQVYPFYLTNEVELVERRISGTGTVEINYTGKNDATPTVKFTGNGTISIEGSDVNYNLTRNGMRYSGIVLTPGRNVFTVTGNGTITFLYQNQAL